MKSNKADHRNRKHFIRIWIRELFEPDFKTTKIITFNKEKIENFVRVRTQLKTSSLELQIPLSEYERRLDVFREKNSKLKYKSEGNIQTEYKEPQLKKKGKRKVQSGG